jgi:hypothetical protein
MGSTTPAKKVFYKNKNVVFYKNKIGLTGDLSVSRGVVSSDGGRRGLSHHSYSLGQRFPE